MHIVSVKGVREFWETHPNAEQPLRAWYAIARRAQWRTPSDIKRAYPSASLAGGNRVVFNIKGNTYRLIVIVEYRKGRLSPKQSCTDYPRSRSNLNAVPNLPHL